MSESFTITRKVYNVQFTAISFNVFRKQKKNEGGLEDDCVELFGNKIQPERTAASLNARKKANLAA
jgi:hypothetical protein